ncbi:MAG: L-threonylcarbamoyladenylate synthase [Armatimonadota bacterium]
MEAARMLAMGKLVAIPTDTVYGLAARLDDREAVRSLYRAKGRPEGRPIPVLVSDVSEVYRLAANVPPYAEELMRRFFPGPLTLVLKAGEWIPEEITAGSGKVGVRMPNCEAALKVIRQCGGALAVTSANLSGCPEALTADEVISAIGDRIDAVLDGGACVGGVPSTVVDVTCEPPAVLRRGALPVEEIKKALSGLACEQG